MAESRAFWSELQRRHVVRAGIAHVVVFWLLAQVAETVLPYVGIVDEPVRWTVVAGVALFPLTLVIAWFFEHPWHRYTSSRVALDLMVIGVIGVSALLWAWRNLPEVVHTRTSIVILPFEFRQDDTNGQSLSRALAYEINGLLMKSRSMDVVGYESANSPMLAGLDLEGISQVLDVQHLLSGTIRSAGESFRVSVNLTDRGGARLWSGEFEERVEDLYQVQERIAHEIERRLGEEEDTEPVANMAAARCPMPTDLASLERYYTARHFVEARSDSEQSRAQLREAVALYEQLMEEHADFAQARSGLAWALLHQTVYDGQNTDRAAHEARAKTLAEEAVALCPTVGEAVVILPNEVDHPNRWINEIQQWELWIELQPEATESWQKYTQHLRNVGRVSDARRMAERTYALNPLSVRAIKALASIYQYERRFEEAVALADRAAELGNTGPNFARQAQAMHACQEDLECLLDNLPPPFRPWKDALRTVYREPATPEEAQVAIDTALELFRDQPMSLNWFNASSCRADHLTPLFFQLWDEALEQNLFWFWPNVWQPRCGNIWSAPEFPAFVEEAGLVEYWRAKGWPDACRPEGDAFVCGQEIFDEAFVADA